MFAQGHYSCLCLLYTQVQIYANAATEALARIRDKPVTDNFYRKPQGSGPGMFSAPCPEIVSDLGVIDIVKS